MHIHNLQTYAEGFVSFFDLLTFKQGAKEEKTGLQLQLLPYAPIDCLTVMP